MKIYIGKSKIHGKGIFVKENIKRGKIIAFIKGKIINFKVKNKKDSLSHPNWVGIEKNHWIDPTPPCRYLNHSCNPSAGIRGKVEIVALKDVKKGEEITIDYSITETDKLWFMKCDCGSKNCRKTIHSIQFLPKKIYNKYAPYIPTHSKNLYLKNFGRKLKRG